MQEEYKLPENYLPQTFISVIIPARNEAANIKTCVISILQQHYPQTLFEVIVIDDHSTDETGDIVRSINASNLRCIPLAEYIDNNTAITAYKKKALATGIAQSKGQLIVTTDADCTVQPQWLCNIATLYEQNKAVMVVGPVVFSSDGSTVQTFQAIDFMSMQGITVATHQLNLGNMCNGANLAFDKAAYESVGGYTGIDHLSSGDDYLLLMKLQKAFPGRIGYLKAHDSIVTTTPQPDWRSFLQQRIRWASKSGKYDDSKLTSILLFVYVFNLSFLVVLIAGFFMHHLWLLLLGMFIIKTIAELYYLRPVAEYFKKEQLLKRFVWLQPLHILYIVVAGFLGFVGVYQWKGRTTK